MFINNGFTFVNVKGTYEIENGTITCLYEYGLIPIYSTAEQSLAHNLLFEFADIKNDEMLVAFLNKYGLATRNSIVENTDNDYLFFGVTKKEYSQFRAGSGQRTSNYVSETDGYYNQILRASKLLQLMESLNDNDLKKMLDCILFFAYGLSYKPSFAGREINKYSSSYNDFITGGIQNGITGERMRPKYSSEIMQDEIDDFKELVEDELWNTYYAQENGREIEYCFFASALHSEWQYLLKLTEWLSNNCPVKSIDQKGEVMYQNNALIGALLKTELHNDLPLIAKAVMLDIVNEEVLRVKPFARYEKQQVIMDWQISTLYEAMYFEFLTSLSQDITVKKCPSCGIYFEVSKSNTRKKYCSDSCNDRMAQRRRREKLKNKN